jgi:hypothetical protein
MALDLTPDELNTVRRAAGSGLTYYNAGLREQTPISSDFEAFLALADTGTKAAAVQWLQTLMAPMVGNINRSALYLACVAFEALDLADQRLQVETFLLGYADFQAGFPGEPRFANIAEVSMIIADSALVIDELIHLRDSLKHRTVMNRVCGGKWGNPTEGVVTEDRKKQAMSWIVPLSVPLTF